MEPQAILLCIPAGSRLIAFCALHQMSRIYVQGEAGAAARFLPMLAARTIKGPTPHDGKETREAVL